MNPYDYGKWTKIYAGWFRSNANTKRWEPGHIIPSLAPGATASYEHFTDGYSKEGPMVIHQPIMPVNYVKIDFTVGKI